MLASISVAPPKVPMTRSISESTLALSLPILTATRLGCPPPAMQGYLTGAPGVDWKPPNSFRPSGSVTVRALAMLLLSFAA